MKKAEHWADTYADKIIRERPNMSVYTCASGITPSGTVHIGNFREIISVELVVRALQDRGMHVRFIYSWDDFDVFRKVPENIAHAEEYAQYLRMPITDIPDPWNRAQNYALGNEKAIETILNVFGIRPVYIYQAQKYKSGAYKEGIRMALEQRDLIRTILNTHRNQDLPEDWWPISIFSSFNKKDTTKILSWDGDWHVTYYCEETQQEEIIDIRTSKTIKLLWRIDWPMRWAYEKVVFEPAGKDHHSQGGSFDTAIPIVSQVYHYQSPISFQYGFVSMKGGQGKLSSSSGHVVSVADVLEIYPPEIIRYLFVSTRPNAEFSISFDLDVIKIYEDYDRCERIYYGAEEVGEKRKNKEQRIYELSQVDGVASDMPPQIPIRHICNILQIYRGDTDGVLDFLRREYGTEIVARYLSTIDTRIACAWNWIKKYAPEDFIFELQDIKKLPDLQNNPTDQAMISLCKQLLEHWDMLTAKDINAVIYDVSREYELVPQKFFTAIYMRLINKKKGPRLGAFLHLLGSDIMKMYFS